MLNKIVARFETRLELELKSESLPNHSSAVLEL